MNTLILMILTTLVTLIYYLPIYAVHSATSAIPIATDRPSTSSSATRSWWLLKRLARSPKQQWPWQWLRLAVTQDYHSQRPPDKQHYHHFP